MMSWSKKNSKEIQPLKEIVKMNKAIKKEILVVYTHHSLNLKLTNNKNQVALRMHHQKELRVEEEFK